MSSNIAVLGAGAWGTALAVQAAHAGSAVRLWTRDPTLAAAIEAGRDNPRLPGIVLPVSVAVTANMAMALDGTAAALLTVPVQHLRAVAGSLPPYAGPVVVAELLPACPAAVLSGPNFAAEIAAGLPAAAVLAAPDPALRAELIALFTTPRFRLYGNDDLIGVQVGGAAKNVIAIAAGVVIGAGFGENARAALVTRGLAELSRLTVFLGGRAETVMGLSGLGDLLLTCTGERSRNFSLGVALGRGAMLADILAERSGVTEGVASAPALLARAGEVDMPICAAVVALIEGNATPRQVMEQLLSRRPRDE
jgi:glycerol-3-phosphate dehydrogenase (NAD(P)+)